MGTRIEVWISDELAAELDEAREGTARGRWIGELIARELHGEPVPSGPLPSTDSWRSVTPPGFPLGMVAPGSVEERAADAAVHPLIVPWSAERLVFVDDPVEHTIPLTPEAKARSAAIWAETAERLAAERDPSPDLP